MEIDIERLALLARIKLTFKEKEKLQKEFGVILDYISQLKEIDISKIDDMEAGKTVDLENVMREDENPHKTGQFSEELLKEAPSTSKGYIKVKHVFE